MALRGDLVGEAFVRITADTTEMRRAIRRAGEEDGKAYGEKFSAEVTKASDATYRRQRQRLAAAISDPKQFDSLARSFDRVEDAAASFREMLSDLNKQNQLNKKELTTYTAAVNNWEKSTTKARDAAFKMAEADRDAAEAKSIQNKQIKNFFVIQNTNLRTLNSNRIAHAKALQREEAALARLNSTTKTATSTLGRDGVVRVGRWNAIIDRLVIGTDRADHTFDRFNTSVGRAFGKGSRNNFVNWIGSMVQGLTTLGTKLVTFPFKTIAHISNSFGDAFALSRAAGAGKLLSAGRGILAVFGGKGGVIGLVLGLGTGLLAVGKLLPGIVSLLSMLGGVVSALVGSIGIGLTGALLAVTPAAIGAAAGLASVFGVINAFAQDPDNEKFWKSVFEEPFKKWAKGFAPQVKTFLTGFRSGFARLFEVLTPSVNAFFDNWDRTMKDPTTQKALDAWGTSIGKIAKSFNVGITSFASGIIGFFVPILPYAEKIATWFSTITTRFNAWANSAKGQNSIAEFMGDAWVAADKVWRILGNIGGIFGSVFSAGNETGTGFLDGILTKLQEINAFLKTPEGKKKLTEWFGNVKTIGEDLGKLAENVGKIITNFNDPAAQESAKTIMNAIVTIAETAEKMSRLADAIGKIMGYLVNPAAAALFGLSNFIAGDRAKNPAPPTRTPASESNVGALVNAKGAFGDLKKVNEQLSEIDRRKASMKDFLITIQADDVLAKQKIAAINAYVFNTKTIPIEGNDDLWNATKGTVAGYVFDTKTVNVEANTKPAMQAILNLKAWLARQSLSKGIRVAGVNAPGGITMASGGILTRPTRVLAGEAGREAFVPLDRPLQQVDPSVRWLSALARGKNMASGGVVGASRVVNVHPGAIMVSSPHADPALVAEQVMDRLVQFA